jgi:prevent-host-death family protein
MKLTDAIKPISYLKAHASSVVNDVVESGEPVIVTQNGKGRVVIQDLREYEATQETVALLKLLAIGNREVENGQVKPLQSALSSASSRIDAKRKQLDAAL